MSTLPFNPDNFLLIAADNWESLRRCDVFRLFDECREENWPVLYDRLAAERPELKGRAHCDADSILCDRYPQLKQDQPLDPLGYARRVALWERLCGLCTSDAQGVADLEFSQAGHRRGGA